ncbi:hypothetical protein HD806DRAFT_545728 [Xylariaceae sp. AK1471]|nr:hypothetical protein HD806DRAFT_545728 [Xylariaceae sp. AK1471]
MPEFHTLAFLIEMCEGLHAMLYMTSGLNQGNFKGTQRNYGATESVSTSYGRLHIHPPFCRLALTPSQPPQAPETAASRPTHQIPSAADSKAVEAGEPEVPAVEEIEPNTTVVEDVTAESSIIESAKSADSIETQSPQFAVEDEERPEERTIQYEPEPSLEQDCLVGTELDIPLSNRIHILGFSAHAKFLGHALASVPGRPPISILAHHGLVMSRWGEENRSLSLYDYRGKHISSARIRCPEPIIKPRRYLERLQDSDFLDNLIIDTTSVAILPSLRQLRHRIDHRTSICLLHTGLGLMEMINEELFPDFLERPNFILGHSTHRVAKFSSYMYSIKHKTPGKIHLYGVPKSQDSTLDRSSLAHEGMRQTQHFLQLLSSTQGLKAVGLPWVRFMTQKLPAIIFSSVADAISVILGCRYSDIYPNDHAMAMWDNLLNETLAIISQFPELQDEGLAHRVASLNTKTFRNKLKTHLISQGPNQSPWIRRVRMGVEPPIDYFNGYFVRRAKELGLDHKHNSMAIEMVKARATARRRELRMDIPLGTSPYMNDGDRIGGGQPSSRLEDDLDMDQF